MPSRFFGYTSPVSSTISEMMSLIATQPVRDAEIYVEPRHQFSLDDCSNLSELTLDMERWESSVVQDPISILSILDPTPPSRLGKSVVEANHIGAWFNKKGRANGDEDWERFDTVLSKLTVASINARGKRLTSILVVVDNKKFVPAVRKWLPRLLPRFNGLGMLHVHCM